MDNDATIPATATGPLFDCDSELIKLIAGSNHGLVRAEKVTADRLGIYIENRDINELAIQLHMARHTVERYLELLEQTYVIFRLPSFSTNPRKEIAKSRKIYFWDTGIRNALLNAHSEDEMRPDIGAVLENWAIAEVAKQVAVLDEQSRPVADEGARSIAQLLVGELR